jgi:hypothetical protein
MFLNLIITTLVGFIILILWVVKGVYDCISTLDQMVKKLAKVTDLLHNRLLHVEKLINDQIETKQDTTNNE